VRIAESVFRHMLTLQLAIFMLDKTEFQLLTMTFTYYHYHPSHGPRYAEALQSRMMRLTSIRYMRPRLEVLGSVILAILLVTGSY
jgi:hypothetical protein